MANDISITNNIALDDVATNNDTSTIGEPSVATNGESIFVTGNWYASRSLNDGGDWMWVDPETTLPSAAGGFCCDQLALFDQDREIWIWLLQYRRDANGTNVFRIAVSDSSDFPNDDWNYWDIAPADLDADWTDVWFDYPDAALSRENLYVTFNIFKGDIWQRAAVMRFPLDALSDGNGLTMSSWTTTSSGSLRLTQQSSPKDTMYWAAHANTVSPDEIKLFEWPDASSSVNTWSVDVRQWSRNISSSAPNGVNWLARADSRITAGTLGSGVMTFMWTAGADEDRPNAYCRVVQIDEASKIATSEPDIWSQTRAWAYPAACANRSGIVGFTAFYGGEDRNPAHMVGARDGSKWRSKTAKLGSHAPNSGRWGDYLNCRADGSDLESWVASGYTLEGGQHRQNIEPRVVRFSLASALVADAATESVPA